MKLRNRVQRLAAGALLVGLASGTAHADVIGQWDFNNSDLRAAVGQPLAYLDGPGGATQSSTSIGLSTALGAPDIAGQPAGVLKFGAHTSPEGFRMSFAADPNGGGSFLNQWTFIADVLYPSDSASKARAILEGDGRLISPDPEIAISAEGGLGANGAFDGAIAANTWYRIGVVVDTTANQVRKYINGQLVGVQPATSSTTPPLDGRWALDPNIGAELFNSADGKTAGGFVNSIQLRSEALTGPQLLAIGSPTADGIPQVIPTIPSFAESFIPAGAFALRNTDVGVILDAGGTVIEDSSLVLKLDTQILASPSIIRDGTRIQVVKSGLTPLGIGTKHRVTLSYVDNLKGAQSVSKEFSVALFLEDFDGLTLGPKVDEPAPGEEVWTKTPPEGWSIDDTGVPGIEDPATDGVTEWAGWSFPLYSWWIKADQQLRETFSKARGIVAVADPDEWDDRSHTVGLYNTLLTTAPIALEGAAADSLFLKLDSSWRPECCDDRADLDNSQTALITASYDGGTPIEVLRWDSTPGSPFFHADNPNESITVLLRNPAGASSVVLTFGLVLAENDWWWAIDNLVISAGVRPPGIVSQSGLTSATAGKLVSLSVVASGGEPLSYQWYRGTGVARTPIDGATSATLTLSPAKLSDAGLYTVTVSNDGGSITADPIQLIVLEPFGGSVTQDLVAHLKFDGNPDDSSERGNNGSEVGTVGYVPGRIGQALSYSSLKDGSSFNYVTFGNPEDLNFSTDVDFSFSFWTRFTSWTGDPSFIGNKNWNSGGNQGYVIATAGNGGLQWNMAPARNDYDSPGGLLNDTNWHHIVVTFQRTGLTSTYLDGNLLNSTPSGAARDLNPPAGLTTNVGQDGTGRYTDGGGVGIADGLIDDLGVWRRAITEPEVKAIYKAALAGKDLAQAAVAPVVGSQLVAYLPFEDSLADASGKGNGGTAKGSIGFENGAVGKALHYSSNKDGSSFNYVSLGTPADLNFGTSQSFSVSFWSKLNAWSGDPAFIGNKDWDSGSNPGWIIATAGDGRVQWNIAADASGARGNRRDFDSAGGIFSDLGWHHVVVVFDRQPGSGVAETYVDGALINSTPWAGVDNQLNTPAGLATVIGQDGAGDYTDGNDVGVDALIDEVGIWRRRLTADEVAGLHAAGLLNLPLIAADPGLTLQLPPGKLKLEVLPQAAGLSFSWAANGGVRLQTADSLQGPWSNVADTLAAGSYQAPGAPTGTRFFRLFRP